MHYSKNTLFWASQDGRGRNRFAVFRREFTLHSPATEAQMEVFADSLYRLKINGQTVAHGPARFAPSHPQYDTHDLLGWLQPGRNLIEIEVNSRGTGCYQAIEGVAGLAAWGSVTTAEETLRLDLPRGWMVAEDFSRDADAEGFSFAQGPIEVRDLRAGIPASAWKTPVAVLGQERLGPLIEREIPQPSEEMVTPTSIVKLGRLQVKCRRLGLRASANAQRGDRLEFCTQIFSPETQSIEVGAFWGPLFLNGHEVKQTRCHLRGNRENARLELQSGWNFLYGLPEILRPSWPWMMEIPDEAHLEVDAFGGGSDCHFIFREWTKLSGEAFEALCAAAPTSLADLPKNDPPWRQASSNAFLTSPAREMAWDISSNGLDEKIAYQAPIIPPSVGGSDCLVVFDFGQEYLGHPMIEVEVSEGTILDVGYDERLSERGDIDFYRCNPFANTADRYILAEGHNLVEGFHERGGRYLQLTFRNCRGPVTIHQVGVRSSWPGYKPDGTFLCDEAIFNWTWEAGVSTQLASMVDGWIDPWRERGLYLGDALVEAHCTAKFLRDRRLERWCLRLWAHTQFPNGQMPDCTPSSHTYALNDYTLLYIQLLWNYWEHTGDGDLVVELLPHVRRILASEVWVEDERGLWVVTEGMQVFLDWGRPGPEAITGTNAALNAFRYRALECAAHLESALGEAGRATTYRDEAERVRSAFEAHFWDHERQCFAASILGGVLAPISSLHANILALAYGLGTPEQTSQALQVVLSSLDFDSSSPPPGTPELYFQYYLLQALYRNGQTAAAEAHIRRMYGEVQKRGAWTIPEALHRLLAGLGSMCHGWSCGPMVFFSERILGVRPLEAGNPAVMLIAPEAETLDFAEGAVPHPSGLIRVSWRVEGEVLRLGYAAPADVKVVVRPEGRLARLPLEVTEGGRPQPGFTTSELISPVS